MLRPATALAVLLFASVSLTADVIKPLTDGIMTKGAAQCGDYWMTPRVADDASVSFIAPDPASELPNAWGAYRLPATTGDATYDTLFSGTALFFSASCYELVHAPAANAHFVTRTINQSTTTLQLEYKAADGTYRTKNLTDLNTLGAPDQVRLACAADASRIAAATATGLHIWDFDGNAFSEPTTLTNAEQGSLALSADGNRLLFSTVSGNARKLALHDLTANTTQELLTLGAKSALDPQLACSADASTIVLRSNSGSLTNGIGYHLVRLTRGVSDWTTQTISLPLGNDTDIDAAEPSLSADGQTVVFTARDPSSTIRQIYLWRAAEPDTLTPLTDATTDCRVPALSPSGRFLAFAIAGDPTHLHTLDLGLSLNAQDVDATVGKPAALSLKTNARPTATLTLAASPTPNGILRDGNNAPVEFNAPITPAQLPLSFTANASQTLTLTATVTDGDDTRTQSFTLTATPPRLHCLSLTADGTPTTTKAIDYTALDASADGNVIVFATTASLHSDDSGIVSDIYRRDLTANTLTLLTGTTEFSKEALTCAIAGDASRIVFVCNNQLYDDTGAALDTDVSATVQPALSHDGTTLAYATTDGTLRLIVNGQAPITLPDTASVTAVALSDDGALLAFLQHDGQLWATATANPAPFRLAPALTGLKTLSLTFNGTTAAVATDDKSQPAQLHLVPVYPNAPNTLCDGLDDAYSVRLAPNGRTAVFSRKLDGLWQLYRRNLITGEEHCLTYNGSLGYGSGDSRSSAVLPVFSHDGETVLFLSTLTNLADSNSLPAGQLNLFAWSNPAPANTTPTLAAPELAFDETHTPITFTVALTGQTAAPDADGDETTIPLADADGDETDLLHATAAKGTVTLLPRDHAATRLAQRLRYTPPSTHFVGTDTLTLHVTDAASTADLTLPLIVRNLNDAPTWLAQPPLDTDPDDGSPRFALTLAEGQTYTLDAAALVDDPDLLNPAPDTDTLTFALSPDAPDWLTLDAASGRLTLAPSHDTASRLDLDGKRFTPTLTVTDLAGATASLPLHLTITNVNRPPVLGTDALALNEGAPLTWDALALADPDQEDTPETLTIHLSAPQHGRFTDRDGQTIPTADLTAGLAQSRFPITFVADATAVNGETLSLHASDPNGAASAAIQLTLTFRRQQLDVTQWWPATTTDDGSLAWTHLAPGWNLLASPVDLDATSLTALLDWLHADQLWLYRDGRFVPASPDALPGALEGFWVFLPALPQNTSFTFIGSRPFAPEPLPRGWSLRTRDAAPSHDTPAFLLQQNALRPLRASDLPTPATPAWLYQR
ncbi:MAG: hypothetical protein ACI4WT_04265 [Oligosphaeraceae bacterium]